MTGTGQRPRLLHAGQRALLLEFDALEPVMAWHADLRRCPVPGQLDLVPAARTLLVQLRDDDDLATARHALRTRPAPPADRALPTRTHELPVVYDGEDLETVAALTGLGSPDAVIRAHTGTIWRAAFTGFAPGFTYLTGGDPRLHVPRLDSPRTAVPAGAVGLAGEFSGIYPRSSPGGWRLIGRTDEPLWDEQREPPALITPGDAVRFRPARERLLTVPRFPTARDQGEDLRRTARPGTSVAPEDVPRAALEVLRPGLLTLIEDLGRPGRAALGVGPSGAADPVAARTANRAVGNAADAAVLEIIPGPAVLRAHRPVVLALTGAPAPARIHAAAQGPTPGRVRTVTPGVPVALDDGDELHLDAPPRGLRTVLAVRGGVDVPPVLGSRSRDTLAGLGPEPCRAGTILPVGCATTGAVTVPEPADPEAAGSDTAEPSLPAPGDTVTLRVLPGPRADWINGGLAALTDQPWTISPRSDRIGVRLEGARPLHRSTGADRELPSEGMVAGAIQVPPDGQPVVFAVDRPLTGGYPVVGVIAAEDLPLLAQCPPGSVVDLRPVL
ncbi:5-oxoprolinase/urea amidolyase family protein [Brachybacterium sp. EF45031]|uniref:5-oxoprolinase subunit B/C family protein n=1 Tax=Brachybacterium sillae TaxID=2810536 RepID=UPI00217D5908|nr:urea amidolyase family protein [Brachybacterium sillae]MCS6712247.1 5-oxoprolinase/urea amidolyase family protein [Brachybacterium sillae]